MNRYNDLDPAVIRRFSIKIGFDYLKSEGVKELFQLYFKDMCNSQLSDELSDQFHYLTPADFKTVYQKLFFMDPDTVNAGMIVDLLKSEEQLKSGFMTKRIGFC